ncbi:MAG: hypothetical protein ACMUEL_08970 [Flavobacteriales bacterium Tduv]
MIVDVSITVRALLQRAPPLVGDRKQKGEKQISQRKERVKKETQSGVDTQGKWLKKLDKLYYEGKKNIGGDKNGMILELHSVAANEHDSRGLKPLISKLGYKPREVYMQTKVTKCQPTCLTFIVEASKRSYT